MSRPGSSGEGGAGDLRPHRALLGIRVQQVPLDRVWTGRISDRLSEGPSSGRVPGSAAHRHQEGQGPHRCLPQRVSPDGCRSPGSGRQRVGHRLHGSRRPNPLRALRGAQCGRGGGREDRRGEGRWAVHVVPGLRRPGRPRRAQQADRGVADQGRRLRCDGRATQGSDRRLRADPRCHRRTSEERGHGSVQSLRR